MTASTTTPRPPFQWQRTGLARELRQHQRCSTACWNTCSTKPRSQAGAYEWNARYVPACASTGQQHCSGRRSDCSAASFASALQWQRSNCANEIKQRQQCSTDCWKTCTTTVQARANAGARVCFGANVQRNCSRWRRQCSAASFVSAHQWQRSGLASELKQHQRCSTACWHRCFAKMCCPIW